MLDLAPYSVRMLNNWCVKPKEGFKMGKVVIIAGTQWGDEGKGKAATYESKSANLAVRSTGGNNAGHTVKFRGRKYALHLVPGAIVHNVESVIAPGVVINPTVLLEDMDQLKAGGIWIHPDVLHISGQAHVIFPYHQNLDALYESLKSSPVGTTRKGIGPCYMDKANRTGIRMYDLLLPPHALAEKIAQAVTPHNLLFKSVKGFEKCVVTKGDIKKLAEKYCWYGETFRDYITDTNHIINTTKGKIVCEGAQSFRLDIDHGDYPMVTSSSPNPSGTLGASPIGPSNDVDVIGVAKAYTSRVGNGPFPTEQDNEIGDVIRKLGNEYGTTTGRPRRTGWPDLVLLKDCMNPMGVTSWCINHLDTLGEIGNEFGYIKVCIAYKYKGKEITHFPKVIEDEITPIYHTLEGGWRIEDDCKNFENLPDKAKSFIGMIESQTKIPVKYIGIGPDDSDVIVR